MGITWESHHAHVYGNLPVRSNIYVPKPSYGRSYVRIRTLVHMYSAYVCTYYMYGACMYVWCMHVHVHAPSSPALITLWRGGCLRCQLKSVRYLTHHTGPDPVRASMCSIVTSTTLHVGPEVDNASHSSRPCEDNQVPHGNWYFEAVRYGWLEPWIWWIYTYSIWSTMYM
jgi:hypothetical protein